MQVILVSLKCQTLKNASMCIAAHADGLVRAAALNYWHSALPLSLHDRYQALLALITLPMPGAWRSALHKRWPAAAATLLVRAMQTGAATGQASGADRPLFGFALGECTFRDMVVSTLPTGGKSKKRSHAWADLIVCKVSKHHNVHSLCLKPARALHLYSIATRRNNVLSE